MAYFTLKSKENDTLPFKTLVRQDSFVQKKMVLKKSLILSKTVKELDTPPPIYVQASVFPIQPTIRSVCNWQQNYHHTGAGTVPLTCCLK